MSGNKEIYFFMGKGGVGKSTLSAATALRMSKNAKTLLVSMDPAHNQSDIFEKKLGEKARSVTDKLFVLEIEMELWIKRYLKDIQNKISDNYRYLSAINVDKKFEILKFSPGLEEYSLLLAYENIIQKNDSYRYLIFDMPPTALALRFFALPKISLVWIENLLALREEIIQKKEMITKIKIGKKTLERDKILNKLNELKAQYEALFKQFRNPDVVKVNIVMNADNLSLKETERIHKSLLDLEIRPANLFLNKVDKTQRAAVVLPPAFKAVPLKVFPQTDYPIIGLDALDKFLRES